MRGPVPSQMLTNACRNVSECFPDVAGICLSISVRMSYINLLVQDVMPATYLPFNLRSLVVYQFTCAGCNACYVKFKFVMYHLQLKMIHDLLCKLKVVVDFFKNSSLSPFIPTI